MKIRLIFLLLLFTAVFFLGIPLVKIIMEKEEKRECLQWREWSKEIKDYYLVSWQKEQCDSLGININAPIKYEGRPYDFSLYF